MALWADNKYVQFLETENRELKDQVKALTDSILILKGAAPVYTKREPLKGGTRVTMNDLIRRSEDAERVQVNTTNG